MKRRIFRFECAKPGDIGGPALPCIQVSDEDDPASETATNIFYYSKVGKAAAERVARDVAHMGVALIYPSGRDIEVYVGPLHGVYAIGSNDGFYE